MRRAYVSSSVPALLLLLLVVAALAVVGCASKSEQAALELAGARWAVTRATPTSSTCATSRTASSGASPTPLSSAVNLSRATDLGVIACTAGDRATEAVRFSSCTGSRRAARAGARGCDACSALPSRTPVASATSSPAPRGRRRPGAQPGPWLAAHGDVMTEPQASGMRPAAGEGGWYLRAVGCRAS